MPRGERWREDDVARLRAFFVGLASTPARERSDALARWCTANGFTFARVHSKMHSMGHTLGNPRGHA